MQQLNHIHPDPSISILSALIGHNKTDGFEFNETSNICVVRYRPSDTCLPACRPVGTAVVH